MVLAAVQEKWRCAAAAARILLVFAATIQSTGGPAGSHQSFSRLWKLKQLSEKKPVVEITFEPDLAVAAVELP